MYNAIAYVTLSGASPQGVVPLAANPRLECPPEIRLAIANMLIEAVKQLAPILGKISVRATWWPEFHVPATVPVGL